MKTTIPDEMISLAKSDVHRIYQRVNNYKVNADNHKAERGLHRVSNQTKRGLGRALTILSIFGFIFCVFTIPRLSLDGTEIIFMAVYSILVYGAIFYLGYRLQHVKTKAKIAEAKREKQGGAQMVSIIKYEGPENVCVWKHPAKTVTTGSLLMIKPPFEAVIAQHGTPMAKYGLASMITTPKHV